MHSSMFAGSSPRATCQSPDAGALSFPDDFPEGFSYGQLLQEARMRHDERKKKDREDAAAAKLAKSQAAAAANFVRDQAAKSKLAKQDGFTNLRAVDDLQTPLLRGN